MTHEELRQAVFERDNFTCQYCGRYGRGVKLEIDHIIPVSKGGATDIRNLITACRECNRAKRNRLLTVGELQEIADKINTSLEYLISLADRPPAPDEDTPRPTEAPAEASPNEGEKRGENVRVNFLLSKEHHEALMSLALLENTTLTEILTEAVKAHIDANSERVKIMREAIKTARSK